MYGHEIIYLFLIIFVFFDIFVKFFSCSFTEFYSMKANSGNTKEKDFTISDKIRIKDIARLAGTSTGTVDRVLHNRGEVAESTRQKVLHIIHNLNYQPDILARRLSAKKKCRFAIFIPKVNPDSSFWQAPLDGIYKAISEIDYYNVSIEEFLFNQFDRSSFARKAKAILNSRPDGIILAPVYYEESVELINSCKQLEIPYVFINSNIEGLNDYGFVGQDAFRSGFLAARLLTYGMKPNASYCVINLARALNNHKHIMSRQRGFEDFFHSRLNGKSNVYIYDIEDVGENEVNRALSHIFISHTDLDGVFVTNSRVFKVARFIKHNKIKPVRLIGYDLINENISYLEDGTVDFLISQKPFEQGYMGVKALFNIVILEKNIKKEYILPIEILTRENYLYYKTDLLRESY